MEHTTQTGIHRSNGGPRYVSRGATCMPDRHCCAGSVAAASGVFSVGFFPGR